jgi:DNA-binding response OmpR family regulator
LVINKRNTVLLVEDDELFSILNKESLLKCGYNVLTAKSAEESIKLTYNNHFDLILMDIDLGEEIDGIQTAKSILDIRDIPIIFFSSHSSLEILQKVEETSSYGYIPKNSDFQILCMSIKMALKLYEAKKKIIERENHYRYIFDQSYDPIFITQTNHQIVDANLATSELFGYSKEELLGLKINEYGNQYDKAAADFELLAKELDREIESQEAILDKSLDEKLSVVNRADYDARNKIWNDYYAAIDKLDSSYEAKLKSTISKVIIDTV